MRKGILLILVIGLLTGLYGCGSVQRFEEELKIAYEEQTRFKPESIQVNGKQGELIVKNLIEAENVDEYVPDYNGEHGIKIDELGIQRVIEAGDTVTISLDNLKPGTYEIDCHLHKHDGDPPPVNIGAIGKLIRVRHTRMKLGGTNLIVEK